MDRALRDKIFEANFSPTMSIHDIEDKLRKQIGLTNKYDSARLAIGRSLAVRNPPDPLDKNEIKDQSLRGKQLFGDEVDIWISALMLDNESSEHITLDEFRALVEAHWFRGANLLRDDWNESKQDVSKFLVLLSDLLPAGGQPDSHGAKRPNYSLPCEARIKVGSVSQLHPGNKAVDFCINGSGVSPHIALMGKTRSGKTTTGLQIAGQIIEQTGIPFLLIDPKGEFVDASMLADRFGFTSDNVSVIEVGSEPIPLDFLPSPEMGRFNTTTVAMQLRDSIVLACKTSGNVQQDLLRTAIEKVVEGEARRDMSAIQKSYESILRENNKKTDSILSRLNEVTSLNCFAPELSIPEFFQKSWVISLSQLGSEELKRLVILLLLDALKSYILRMEDSAVDSGFRTLRHLLVIDEAKRILAEKNYQSLVDIVRQGASKGSAVMLLSQDPSDFDGQADDFTTQLGTVVAFACSQTERGLRNLQGVYGRKVQSQEFADTTLPTGVAFCKLPGREPERIKCWE